MKINVAPYVEDNTSSVINMHDSVLEIYDIYKQYWVVLHKHKLTSLELFKKAFGRQKLTKDYTCRNWVWTFTDDEEKGILYCLVSKEGPSWEFDSTTDMNVVMSLLVEAIEKLIEK